MQPHLFIFGLGFTAQTLAHAAMKQGYNVSGTTRSEDKCTSLKAQGIHAYLFDQITPEILADTTHILSSIPPQEAGDIVLPLIPKAQSLMPYLAYFSTTGVYGDYAGAWVDETSELRSNNARLQRRVQAEQAWQARGGHIFRLAGIYGPGRNALEDVRAGDARRIDKPGQVFSRIHVEDIAQMALASMQKPNPGAVYNVCDDEPAAAHEVVAYACELLGQTPPPLIPFEQAAFSPMGREFYSANRRVSNRRIKQELGLTLTYPDYRAGLKALLC